MSHAGLKTCFGISLLNLGPDLTPWPCPYSPCTCPPLPLHAPPVRPRCRCCPCCSPQAPPPKVCACAAAHRPAPGVVGWLCHAAKATAPQLGSSQGGRGWPAYPASPGDGTSEASSTRASAPAARLAPPSLPSGCGSVGPCIWGCIKTRERDIWVVW
jgi:hypothetical protein